MQILVLSATLIGSLATAWMIQRAILELCVRAIAAGAAPAKDDAALFTRSDRDVLQSRLP
jgi:hypothetical protein